MLKNKVQAIVLAAGRSTRFNSGRTKLSERILRTRDDSLCNNTPSEDQNTHNSRYGIRS